MKKIIIFISIFLIGFSTLAIANSNGTTTQEQETEKQYEELYSEYDSNLKVNMSTEILGTVERKTPEISNGGLSSYPKYNQGFSGDKEAVKAENLLLNAQDGKTYDSMDQDGNLYLNGEPVEQKFYKHTAAESHFYHDVEQSQEAVIKRITVYPTYRTDDFNAYITGLYAPAGEVFKVEMSSEDRAALGEVKVVMGLTSSRVRYQDVPANRINRMPNQVNQMQLTSESGYFGSYLGGPIYIAFKRVNRPITFTITGAVEYHHYIHGLTTQEDFERTMKSTAPFFDLMAGDDLIRLSGPRKYATLVNGEEPTFDDMFNMAKLWRNISVTSRKIKRYGHPEAPITMLYDSFISAGAALAVTNADLTFIPCDWLSQALDYDYFIKNGSWGNMHEYNHHFASIGAHDQDGGEVTNNVTNLISYGLYTDVSSGRSKNNSSLSDWNRYTDPAFVMTEIREGRGSSGTSALASYAQLLYSFGEDIFIEAGKNQRNFNQNEWYKEFSKTVNYDMTYYFETLLGYSLTEEAKTEIKQLNLPTYVPIASIYQTGLGYAQVDNNIQYSNLTKPYVFEYGSNVIFDITTDVVIPKGFEISVKNYSSENDINIKQISDTKYEFDIANMSNSGKIYFTFELKNTNLGIVSEIPMVLDFVQDGIRPEVKTYYYTDETMYRSVIVADAMNFKGCEKVETAYNYNSIVDRQPSNTISVMEGKVYIEKSGKYLFGLKGLDQILLYTSVNSDDYKLTAFVNKEDHSFDNQPSDSSCEYNLEAGDYLYFKVILRTGHKSGNGYGWAHFAMSKYDEVNESYNLQSVDNRFLLAKTVEYKEPDRYQYEEKYEYNYSTQNEIVDFSNAEIIESTNANPWGNSNDWALKNAFDGNNGTYFHNDTRVDENNKFSVTLALEDVASFNYIEFTPYWKAKHTPTEFKIYTGMTKEAMTLLYESNGTEVENDTARVKFNEFKQFKYLKIEVSKTTSGNYIAVGEFRFARNFDDAKMLNLDSKGILYSKGDFNINNHEFSFYGHTYNGNVGGVIKLTVNGNYFGIRGLYGKLKVTIDGKEYYVTYDGKGTPITAFYVNNLADGEHTVTIEILENSSLDSFYIQ